MSAGRRLLFVAVTVAMLALLGWRIVVGARRGTAPIRVDLTFTSVPEEAWGGTTHLVADARAGHRMRKSHVDRVVVAPLGDPDAIRDVDRHTNAQGLVRSDDLGATIPGPRVLVLGDDQTTGAVEPGELWTARLEATLRARGGRLDDTTVLNAACDRYGLAHYVLRGPELVERYAPRVVVLALSTGDDVVALDDQRYPHLDDGAAPAGPKFPPQAEPLGIGPRAAALCPGHPDLALLGLAQAAYRSAVPEREPILDRKLRQCITWMRDVAPRNSLIVLLIPPADLARPDEVAPLCSEQGRALVASDVQERAHAAVVTALEVRGAAYVDLLPALRAADGPDVYRTDGRLGARGHAIAAEQIADRVEGIINRR